MSLRWQDGENERFYVQQNNDVQGREVKRKLWGEKKVQERTYISDTSQCIFSAGACNEPAVAMAYGYSDEAVEHIANIQELILPQLSNKHQWYQFRTRQTQYELPRPGSVFVLWPKMCLASLCMSLWVYFIARQQWEQQNEELLVPVMVLTYLLTASLSD